MGRGLETGLGVERFFLTSFGHTSICHQALGLVSHHNPLKFTRYAQVWKCLIKPMIRQGLVVDLKEPVSGLQVVFYR